MDTNLSWATDKSEGVFNLKVVVQETGVKPDALRAWERRYGIPKPTRTPGGHRLYSQEDIDTLKWLVARQEEGLSISKATKLWKQLTDNGRKALPKSKAKPQSVLETLHTHSSENLNQLRQAWIHACGRFDETQAEYILTQAFSMYPQEAVVIEVLQKGLSEIGYQWYVGDLTVQQEHFTSALATRRLEALIAASPAPVRDEMFLVGCPAQEDHAFAALMLTLLLRRRGWPATYLGVNIPTEQMGETLKTLKPAMVIMSAQQLHSAASLKDMAHFLKSQNVPLAYGGAIFNATPKIIEHIPGHFLGRAISDVIPTVTTLLNEQTPLPTSIDTAPEMEDALNHYREKRTAIEAVLWEFHRQSPVPSRHMAMANHNLAQGVTAALSLGDMEFLDTDIQWLSGLLINRPIQTSTLKPYLKAYEQAAKIHLDKNIGKPVLNWLRATVEHSEQDQEK